MATSNDDSYPDGGGALPGGTRRRRGPLPGGGEHATPAPLSTSAAPADLGDLAMTTKQQLPDPKVWGLRVSEPHYNTARAMTGALAVRYQLDQRQVGELIVQFLVQRRFDLDQYVSQQVGPAIDLDFFAQPQTRDE
jgi:hypothetical protein